MRRLLASIAAIASLALASCAARPAAAPAPAPAAAASILQASDPAPGATVAAPLNALTLHFSPPARLDELLVQGPDGSMPMMVTAAGEQARYSVPLPGLGSGAYTVSWRATAARREHKGSFAFTVK